MSIKRFNEFPDGSGVLSNDDVFVFMDDPSGDGVTKKISVSQLANFLGVEGGVITQQDLDNAIAAIVDAAPETLNTLNELAAAINNNPDFFSEVSYSGGNISQFINDAGYLTSETNDLTSSVTWANVPDANITESAVVQHSGALKITESQIVDLQPYLTDIIQDISPQLGGNLDLNTFNINGTGNISIDGNIVANTGTFDVVSFDVANESILTKGQISWNDTEGVVGVGLTDNSTIYIGEHRFFRIRNETGAPLYKGQVVYASGVHSNGLITPTLYVADGTVREVRFMGVVLETINTNNNGYIIDFGQLHDMDLDGSASNYAVGDETWVAGDILYVHPTVAGKLTKVEPKHSISVAIVLDPGNGNGNGRMFVRPTSYGHLNDNHDVDVSTVSNGQYLRYDATSDYWIPTSEGSFSSLNVTGTSGATYLRSDLTVIGTGSIPLPVRPIEILNHTNINDKLSINYRTDGFGNYVSGYIFPVADGLSDQAMVTDGLGNIGWSNVVHSDTSSITGASTISNMVQISQADYDAIPTPDPQTLYIIVG